MFRLKMSTLYLAREICVKKCYISRAIFWLYFYLSYGEISMELNALTALSPIDGRYQDKAAALRQFLVNLVY